MIKQTRNSILMRSISIINYEVMLKWHLKQENTI